MPKPVSQFVLDYVSGAIDRAEALCDWRKLTDAQFRKKWRVDGETARKLLGVRDGVPANFRAKVAEFTRRLSGDRECLDSWANDTLKEFTRRFGFSWRVAEAVLGPRPHGRYGLNRGQKKFAKERTWVDDYRESRALAMEEARRLREAMERIVRDDYSHELGNPVGFVGSVNIFCCVDPR